MRPVRQSMSLLGRQLRTSTRPVALMVLLGVVDVLATLSFVWLSKRMIDIVTGEICGSAVYTAIMLVAAQLIQILCRVAANYCDGAYTVCFSNRLRERLFRIVMNSRVRSGMHSGDIVSRLEEDIRVVSDFVCSVFPAFLVTLIQLVAASAFLIYMQADMAWILLLIMPVAVVGSRLFFRKLRQLGVEIRADEAAVQGMVQENIQHVELVKSLCSEDALQHRLEQRQSELKRKVYRRLDYSSISRFFMRIGFAGGYAFVFLWGALGIQKGVVSYGMLVAFLQLVGQVQRPVADMARYIPSFIRALSSEERLLDLEELPQEPETETVMLEGAPGISLRNLNFSYGEDREPVFRDFSFDFAPGTMTAVLGHTGVGKSTLVKLMMSLLDPDSGTIDLYDGVGVSVAVSPSTRCNFMYVPQGNSLMSGTIRENLLSSKPSASEEELREVLSLAAAEFVFDLKKGLDTQCSERGGGLSEGQAQRVAIARALLRPGGVLVLDESTASLDPETERLMLERLVRSCHGNKTIVCITHREFTASIADSVLDLDRLDTRLG